MKKKTLKKDKGILPKHRVFVCALASGKERADAYIAAYPKAAHRARAAISRLAYKLLQRPEVLAAYNEELEKHRIEEEKLNRWTYERSVKTRINAIKDIEEERERRKSAQSTLAKAMLAHPPEGMSAEDVVLEVQRILMMPVLTTQTTQAIAQLCEGLDKLTGLQKDDGGGQVNVFIANDPRDR